MEHDRRFNGKIRRTVDESTPAWESTQSRLSRQPNIVMIVLDDVGYSQLGCYGGDIDTPNLDSLAADGLRYANFHVTPLCSPTRTCLLTGRNHHSVGMGRVSEMTNGFPNTRGFASKEAANLAELLRPHGYQTLAAGKWHLASIDETSPAGPYDHWPLQRGFDRFHGFLAGETNQWNPELIQGNERVEPQPKNGHYHLSEDIIDQSCKWLRQLTSADPDKPFFLYAAFAAGHSPHHVPRQFPDKYRGRFDGGWDVERDRTLARQKQSGLLPEQQRLAPRNPGVQLWEDLPEDEKRLATRLQEVFAGFMDHTDVQIGRLLDQIDALGKREDTIVIAISDNGASSEGGPHGTYDHQRARNGFGSSVAENMKRLDDLAGRAGVGWWPEPRHRWVLYQDAVFPHFFKAGPRVRGVSHRITARIQRRDITDDGVIIADGGRFGGWTIYIRDNRLHYTTNNFGERCRLSSPVAIPPGAATLRADVVRSGKDEGRVRFYINDQESGEGVLSPFRYYNFVNEPMEVGRDSQTPVDDAYGSPYEFHGHIVDVVIEAFGTEVVDQGVLLSELMGSQ